MNAPIGQIAQRPFGQSQDPSPTLKKTQTSSFSRFLERQSRLSYKKVFFSLELYFFRLKNKKELSAVRKMTTLQPFILKITSPPYESEDSHFQLTFSTITVFSLPL